MTVIDSFLIALGFKIDDQALGGLRKKADEAKESILSIGHALVAAAAGIAIHKIAEIGSQFEQNRIQIAGFLSALGLSSDFNAGLEDAAGIMKKITTDAAKLPGEAEEYIEVFKANAAFLKNGMPGANAAQMSEFTNRLTAISKTVASNLDAAQIARESSQLLAAQGRAGGHNVLWQRLLPFLMQVKGQANITAQSFNAMTQPKRVQLLQAAFEKLQPMLDASANSFDAMYGAVVSTAKQLLRMATAPIFAGMKVGLDKINSLVMDADGNLTEFGKSARDFGQLFSSALVKAVDFVVKIVSWLMKFKGAATALKVILGALALQLAALGLMKVIGMVGALARGLLDVRRILTGGLIGAIFLISEDLYRFYTGGLSVTGLLVSKFAPALTMIKIALGVLVGAFLVVQGAAVAAAVSSMAAWIAATAPILATVAAVAALIVMFKQLSDHKGFFQDRVHSITDKFGHLFGLELDPTKAALGKNGAAYDMSGSGVLAPSGASAPFGLPGYGFVPPPRGGAVGSASGSSKTTSVHIENVNIQSTDPKGAVDEMHRRVIRSGQTGVAY